MDWRVVVQLCRSSVFFETLSKQCTLFFLVCHDLSVFQRGGSHSAPRFKVSGIQALRKQLLKYANTMLSRKNWEMSISSVSSSLSPGVITSEEPFLCYHPIEPMNTSPTSHQNQATKRCVLWAAATKMSTPDVHKLVAQRH